MADDIKGDPGKELSSKDLFYHLFAELKGLNDLYTKYVFTTTATQVLIIGWFISDKAPTFKTGAACVVYGAIVFFTLIEVVISYHIWQLSKATGDLIKELRLTEEKYYIFKQIKGGVVAGMVIAHAILYILLGTIIYFHK